MEVYNTLNDIPEGIDKEIIYLNEGKIKEYDFVKEKDVVDFIVNDIETFVKEFLNDELISFEIEKRMSKYKRAGENKGRRLDLYIVGKNNTYLIEVKNPKHSCENITAIGQILEYGMMYSDSKKELIIITTFFDIDTARTIEYYKLPIRYIYLSKKHIFEYKGGVENA